MRNIEQNQVDWDELHRRWDVLQDIYDDHETGRRLAVVLTRTEKLRDLPKNKRKVLGKSVALIIEKYGSDSDIDLSVFSYIEYQKFIRFQQNYSTTEE